MTTAASPSVTLRELPLAERPRERLRRYGLEALSKSELLAIMRDPASPAPTPFQ